MKRPHREEWNGNAVTVEGRRAAAVPPCFRSHRCLHRSRKWIPPIYGDTTISTAHICTKSSTPHLFNTPQHTRIVSDTTQIFALAHTGSSRYRKLKLYTNTYELHSGNAHYRTRKKNMADGNSLWWKLLKLAPIITKFSQFSSPGTFLGIKLSLGDH